MVLGHLIFSRDFIHNFKILVHVLDLLLNNGGTIFKHIFFSFQSVETVHDSLFHLIRDVAQNA